MKTNKRSRNKRSTGGKLMKTKMTRKNRKMKIVSKTRFAMSMTLMLVFILSTSMIAFATFDSDNANTNAVEVEQSITYSVQSGDTLWSIASDINTEYYNQEKDIRKLIRIIQKSNKLSGNTIYSGQELTLPIT